MFNLVGKSTTIKMENKSNAVFTTPKLFLKTLSMIHLVLLFGIVLFGVVTFTKNTEAKIEFNSSDVYLYVLAFTTIIAISLGNYVFKQQISKLLEKESLKEKLVGYQSASIVNYAFIEAPALLSIVIFFMEGNLLYLVIAGLLAVYFFSLRPTKDKVETNLDLNGIDKSQFNNLNQEL